MFEGCAPECGIPELLERLQRHSGASPECYVCALALLNRLAALLGRCGEADTRTVNGLFVCALMVSAKVRDDQWFTNAAWASVAGVRLELLNAMEAQFLSQLQWNLEVGADEYARYGVMLSSFARNAGPAGRAQAALVSLLRGQLAASEAARAALREQLSRAEEEARAGGGALARQRADLQQLQQERDEALGRAAYAEQGWELLYEQHSMLSQRLQPLEDEWQRGLTEGWGLRETEQQSVQHSPGLLGAAPHPELGQESASDALEAAPSPHCHRAEELPSDERASLEPDAEAGSEPDAEAGSEPDAEAGSEPDADGSASGRAPTSTCSAGLLHEAEASCVTEAAVSAVTAAEACSGAALRAAELEDRLGIAVAMHAHLAAVAREAAARAAELHHPHGRRTELREPDQGTATPGGRDSGPPPAGKHAFREILRRKEDAAASRLELARQGGDTEPFFMGREPASAITNSLEQILYAIHRGARLNHSSFAGTPHRLPRDWAELEPERGALETDAAIRARQSVRPSPGYPGGEREMRRHGGDEDWGIVSQCAVALEDTQTSVAELALHKSLSTGQLNWMKVAMLPLLQYDLRIEPSFFKQFSSELRRFANIHGREWGFLAGPADDRRTLGGCATCRDSRRLLGPAELGELAGVQRRYEAQCRDELQELERQSMHRKTHRSQLLAGHDQERRRQRFSYGHVPPDADLLRTQEEFCDFAAELSKAERTAALRLVYSHICRSCVASQATVCSKKSISPGHFPGQMSTGLDGSKLFSLGSNGCMQLPAAAHTMCEMAGFVAASSATVSRCGMILVHPGRTAAVIQLSGLASCPATQPRGDAPLGGLGASGEQTTRSSPPSRRSCATQTDAPAQKADQRVGTEDAPNATAGGLRGAVQLHPQLRALRRRRQRRRPGNGTRFDSPETAGGAAPGSWDCGEMRIGGLSQGEAAQRRKPVMRLVADLPPSRSRPRGARAR